MNIQDWFHLARYTLTNVSDFFPSKSVFLFLFNLVPGEVVSLLTSLWVQTDQF